VVDRYQTSLGQLTGASITSGGNNVFIGYNCGNKATSAIESTFIGNAAGRNLTTGIYCTAVGSFSLAAIASNYNTCIGAYSGTKITGQANTLVGTYSCSSATSADFCVSVGYAAGDSNVTGDSSIYLGYRAGYYATESNVLYIDNQQRSSESDGKIKALIYGVFAATTAAQYLTINGHLIALEDLTTPHVLAHELKTDTTAPADLTITCGADKTLILATPTYNDANVGSLVLQTGGTLPGIVEILDNDGDATGIYTRGFAVNEQGSGVMEVPHDYKEGTDLVFHAHWGIQDAPAGGTDNVKWQLIYSIARDANTFPDAISPAAVQVAVTTQYNWVRTDLATITGTTGGVDGGNIKVGDQFFFTVKRIAASADEFGGEGLIATMGFHYQCDTLGSRTISAK
jgi:hypothetical protein